MTFVVTVLMPALGLILGPREAHAGDPTLVWRTWTSEHFQVHAHVGLTPIAKRVLEIAEHVNARLAPELGWSPTERTHIVLTDDTDSANGSATSLPYDTVRLFVTAPEDISPLNDYDDWLVELVTHEYTHILHTDHITGLPAIYNAIFGKRYSPNQSQPRWLLEGLAVLEETKLTTGGRNRSSLFDMYLRADALEGNVASIDQITHLPRRWPQGNLWYLYGSRFLEWIESAYGAEALRSVAHDYGSQLIPFGINRAIHHATGKTYVELYDAWTRALRERYAAQRAAIVARGVREGRRLTFEGQDAFYPRHVPTAVGEPRRVAYFRNDGHTTQGLYELELPSVTGPPVVREALGSSHAAPRLLARTTGLSTAAFLPDGGFVYESGEVFRRIYVFSDLFRRRPDGAGSTRLTFGMRAHAPSVSPDGLRVAFVVDKASTSHLYMADLEERDGAPIGPPRKLIASRRYEQVYTPRWSPDGRSIAFSAWADGGFRDVKIVDVASGIVTEVTHDRALDTAPAFSPDGRTLYFASDRSGVSNIYAYHRATRELSQVTNVVNGAFQPEPSPDGRRMIYVGYTHEGYDLFEIELDPAAYLRAMPYVDARGPLPPEPPQLDVTPKSYDPLPTLRPYAWEFEFRPDAFGQSVVVTTRGADVVGHHAFAASIASSFSRGEPGLDVSYVYRRLPWDTRAHGYRYIAPRGGYRFGDATPIWIEQTIGADVGVSIPLSHAFTSQSVALSYSFARFHALDELPRRYDPYARPPVIPQTGFIGTLHLAYSWSNVERFLWSVGGEKGVAASVAVDVARKELASEYDVTAASYNIVGYVPNPFVRHHVLALHAQGGATAGNFARRGAFGLGGFVDIPLPDALRNVLFQPGVALRGYKPGARFGDSFQLFNAEYRFPIVNVDRGLMTLPGFVERVYGNVFADYGDATFGRLDLLKMKLGLGAELLTDFVLGYFVGFTLRIGVARGTSEGGITQYYTVLSQLF